jgi:nucleotide-binding universal stress UspA family protein
MAYKTILAHISAVEQVEPLLNAAIPLARSNGAHLIGLNVVSAPHIYVGVAAEMSAMVLESQLEYSSQRAEQAKRAFENRTRYEDVACEWRQVESGGYSVADVINAQAASADLIIAGQSEPDGGWDSRSDDLTRVIMGCGRPVLIVPPELASESIGKNVCVAWNGAREVVRAVFDALPILQKATDVKVLTLDQTEPMGRAAFTPGDAITLSLVRHDSNAEAIHCPSSGSRVGEDLLSYAAEFGSDLLVMGCYGHARFREFVFGGVTRHVLQHSIMPVLMSH